MADRIIYLDRSTLNDGMWRHRIVNIYDSTGDPLPSGEVVPSALNDVMAPFATESAGVTAGDHLLRVHTFDTPTGVGQPVVVARAQEQFAARQVTDIAIARTKRTIDSQRGLEIAVV